MNVHDAVTRTMINNFYCQKESLIDALKVKFELYIENKSKIIKNFRSTVKYFYSLFVFYSIM